MTIDSEGLYGGEILLFWNDLSFAGLIPGSFALDTGSATGPSSQPMPGQSSDYFPDARIGGGNSIAVFAVEGYEKLYGPELCGNQTFCYAIIGYPFVQVAAAAFTPGLTPEQAYAIDTKMDDGAQHRQGNGSGPNTGNKSPARNSQCL